MKRVSNILRGWYDSNTEVVRASLKRLHNRLALMDSAPETSICALEAEGLNVIAEFARKTCNWAGKMATRFCNLKP